MTVKANPRDVREDLHTFVCYVAEHEIKRSHRSNSLPKAVAARLGKKMTGGEAAAEVEERDSSRWIDYVDHVSRLLGFVSYDLKGSFAGDWSLERSFPDNYIEFKDTRYQSFLRFSLQKQEEQMLSFLLAEFGPCDNEFFSRGPVSVLDRFDYSGCNNPITQSIAFAKVRRNLLEMLSQCAPGVWLSVASLIAYLKHSDPYFLIPHTLPRGLPKHISDSYHVFRERSSDRDYKGIGINASDPDRFERVEGRFVERFLEGIPLELGYVEVAYGEDEQQRRETSPSFGMMKAFRVTDRLIVAVGGKVGEAQVTVLPNLEIHVDSRFYPARVLQTLSRFGSVIRKDSHSVVKLTKVGVAAAVAENPDTDVIATLRAESAIEVPKNVEKQISAWVGHADSFVLYDGFGLVEGTLDRETRERFSAIEVASDLYLVNSPKKLHERFDEMERVPITVKHPESRLAQVSARASSRFAGEASEVAKPKRERYTLRRTTRITLEFPYRKIFDLFVKALLDQSCLVEADNDARTVTYSPKQRAAVSKVLESLGTRYDLRVKEE